MGRFRDDDSGAFAVEAELLLVAASAILVGVFVEVLVAASLAVVFGVAPAVGVVAVLAVAFVAVLAVVFEAALVAASLAVASALADAVGLAVPVAGTARGPSAEVSPAPVSASRAAAGILRWTTQFPPSASSEFALPARTGCSVAQRLSWWEVCCTSFAGGTTKGWPPSASVAWSIVAVGGYSTVAATAAAELVADARSLASVHRRVVAFEAEASSRWTASGRPVRRRMLSPGIVSRDCSWVYLTNTVRSLASG